MSRDERLARLGRTCDELAAAIDGSSDALLSRRPGTANWAAKEVVCHLRDIEEILILRFYMMLGTEEPEFLVLGERSSHGSNRRGHVTCHQQVASDLQRISV